MNYETSEPVTVRELIAQLRKGNAAAQIAADLLETRATVSSEAQPQEEGKAECPECNVLHPYHDLDCKTGRARGDARAVQAAPAVPDGWYEVAQEVLTVMDKAKKLLRAAGFTMEGGTISEPYNVASDKLRALIAAAPSAPAVPEGWINNPDSIPKPIIDACRDAIRKEFGNNGTDGYYKRILAKVFQSIAAASSAPAVPEGWKHTITRAAECLEILNERPRPMCRDCADENGICPNGGLDCDMRKLIADVRALAAAPSAPAVSADTFNHNFSVELVERVRKACTRMGIATSESLEHCSVELESMLYALCRSIDSMFERVRAGGSVSADPPALSQQEPVAIDIELVENEVYGGLHIRHWKAHTIMQAGKYTLYASPGESH